MRRRARAWDCIVVGAGPAGLNAALVLGRARRRVLVLDNAQPRNYATHEMHGVLGHDGLDPADLRARGRAELGRYGVEVVTADVQDAEVLDGAVRLSSARGADLTRTVLLATGMLDEVPDIPGFADLWGTSAHTCPYCDGFEHRDERLAVLAAGARGEHLAVVLRQWSADVVLLSNGPHELAADQLARVHALAIPIIETPVVALDGDVAGRLRRVRFDNGETLDRDALFFYVGWRLRIDVARALGCRLRDDGSIAVDSEPGDDRRPRLRRRQLRRTAGARPGGGWLRRHRRGRDQRPPELRGRRPRRRRLPRAGARLRDEAAQSARASYDDVTTARKHHGCCCLRPPRAGNAWLASR